MKLFVNGTDICSEIGMRILTVTGREQMEQTLTEESLTGVDGSFLYSRKYPARDITITYQMYPGTLEGYRIKHDRLNQLLHGDLKLIFDDEPDKYFTAVKATANQNEITFHCPDPFKYSTTLKEVSASNGKFSITNNGSVPVPIRYEINFPSDCGFVALVSKDGALELGSREEADKKASDGDEVLIKWSDVLNAGYDRTSEDNEWGPYRYPHNMKKVTAKGSGAGAIQHDFLELDTSTGTKAGNWICGSKKVITLPNDSNGDSGALNWSCYFFNWFEAGQMGQTGEQTVEILDTDNETIGKFTLYKTDTSGNTGHVTFTIKAGVVKDFETQTAYWEPYGSGNRGHGAITKKDDWIEFYFNGGYYRFHDAELKTRKAAKVKITIADNLTNTKYMTINRISEFSLTKFGVEGYTDLPNTFGISKPLVIDGSEGKSYVNGQYRPELEILGSEYVKAKPGDNEIELALSSWFTGTIDAKAYIREAWI